MTNRSPIPQEWIKNYVDTLLAFAQRFGPNSVMGASAMLRADHAMDLVKAWIETPDAVGDRPDDATDAPLS